MGPIEAELRNCPGPDVSDHGFFKWAWELSGDASYSYGAVPQMCAFNAISFVQVKIGKRRVGAKGRGITNHSTQGRLRDAISEAIEVAEALGL